MQLATIASEMHKVSRFGTDFRDRNRFHVGAHRDRGSGIYERRHVDMKTFNKTNPLLIRRNAVLGSPNTAVVRALFVAAQIHRTQFQIIGVFARFISRVKHPRVGCPELRPAAVLGDAFRFSIACWDHVQTRITRPKRRCQMAAPAFLEHNHLAVG